MNPLRPTEALALAAWSLVTVAALEAVLLNLRPILRAMIGGMS